MRERTLLFGRSHSLVGVVTEPETAGSAPDRPALVMLNAGIMHHVGPNRIHVKLARRLARDGFVALRFDYSGIGDSPPRQDGVPFSRRALEETADALDYLQSSRRLERFVLLGLCSGADNALRFAASDPRVAGAILIEGHVVPTLGYLLRAYRRQWLDPRSWWRFLSGRSELWLELFRVASTRKSSRGTDRIGQESLLPSRQSLVSDIGRFDGRGGRLLLIYSEGSPSHHFYVKGVRRRIGAARRNGSIQEVLVQGADHIFTHPRTQSQLFDTVREWMAPWRSA